MKPPQTLTEVFLAHAPAPLCDRWREHPQLAALLDGIVARGRGEHRFSLDPARFIAHVAHRLAPDSAPEALELLNLEALYLACACGMGLNAALEQFDQTYLATLERDLGSLRGPSTLLDDVRQQLRQQLFAGPTPKIAEYAGRGDLRRWVRMVATRQALNLMRGPVHSEDAELDTLVDCELAVADPEIEFLKRQYRAEFKAAFGEALAVLDPGMRTVLRQYHLDGLTADQLGNLYSVHQTTMLRRLGRARHQLLSGVQQRLTERLRISRTELDSILRLIQSKLDFSWRETS
jgi:RNA polymerase sigma-70 factor, ECF subfamily